MGVGIEIWFVLLEGGQIIDDIDDVPEVFPFSRPYTLQQLATLHDLESNLIASVDVDEVVDYHKDLNYYLPWAISVSEEAEQPFEIYLLQPFAVYVWELYEDSQNLEAFLHAEESLLFVEAGSKVVVHCFQG